MGISHYLLLWSIKNIHNLLSSHLTRRFLHTEPWEIDKVVLASLLIRWKFRKYLRFCVVLMTLLIIYQILQCFTESILFCCSSDLLVCNDVRKYVLVSDSSFKWIHLSKCYIITNSSLYLVIERWFGDVLNTFINLNFQIQKNR